MRTRKIKVSDDTLNGWALALELIAKSMRGEVKQTPIWGDRPLDQIVENVANAIRNTVTNS